MSSSRSSSSTVALDRRRVLALGGGLLAVPLFDRSAVAHAQDATAVASPVPVAGGMLRLGVQGDPTTLDPHLTVLAAAGLIVGLVYEGLVEVDADLVPRPAIAESWDISPDGLTYTFTLRDNVAFHNGRALVAADVEYSLQRIMDPAIGSPSASYVSGIETIEIPDDRTVVVTLSAPDASFLTKLAFWGVAVVPREVVEQNGDLALTAVGTGPFTFAQYTPGTSITLGRHRAYREPGKPYLDGLEIAIIPTDTSRTTALVSDTVDLIEQVPQRDIGILEGDENIVLAGGLTTNLRWIVFNLRRPPFDQLDFRQAVARAIDRAPIIESAVFGYGTPLLGLYPEDFWAGYEGEIPAPDPEGAEALLGSVTIPEGFAPQILAWAQYEFLNNSAVVVQEQLRQVGIEAEIDARENAIYIENYFAGNFDIAVMGASGYMDPDEWIGQSLKTDGVNNAAGYSNPELDDLLAAGLGTTDQAERAAIYQQVQQVIIDDAPWISLYTSQTFEGLQARVQGFEHYLSGGMASLRNVWLSE